MIRFTNNLYLIITLSVAELFNILKWEYKRVAAISAFKDGRANILVSCRVLDEGFDVPNTDTGIIVAGTSSVRQWIQRMGRILRKAPGKQYSKIYVVLADQVEHNVFTFTNDDLTEFQNEALSIEEIDFRHV